MNIEEENFKRVYYKVQVPDAFIPTLSFRLKYNGFYVSFFWLFLTILYLYHFISGFSKQDFTEFYATDKSTVGAITGIDFSYDSENNDTTFIYEFHYNAEGNNYVNTGYYKYRVYSLNDSIKVFYKVENPALAKAEYLDAAKSNPRIVLFFGLMFLIIGVAMLYYFERKSNLLAACMRNGVLTLGVYQSHTSDSESDSTNFIYEYMDRNKKSYRVTASAQDNEIIYHTDVLYSEEQPQRAIVLHAAFLKGRFNRDTIIQLVHEYATKIEVV